MNKIISFDKSYHIENYFLKSLLDLTNGWFIKIIKLAQHHLKKVLDSSSNYFFYILQP